MSRAVAPNLMPDAGILLLGVALMLVGLVAISSASIEYADINYKSTWFHTIRHLIYMALALSAAFVVYRIPLQFWEQTGWIWLFIALALINNPELVFLDELTTGLDPQARRTIWDLVRDIKDRGKTVFLTTHLMEEAERLCDRVAIIEHGRIVDHDSPAGLIARHCPQRRTVVATAYPNATEAFGRLTPVDDVSSDGEELTVSGRGDDLVTAVIHAISEHQMQVTAFRTERPTLEDVFLTLTGHSIRD